MAAARCARHPRHRTAPGRPAAIEQGARRRWRCSTPSIRSIGASLAEALAKEIAKQGRHPLLFVEINTGAEPQKAGVLPQDADGFLAACRDRYGLEISGLMCIPPHDEAPAPHFALTAKIARRNGLKLLSMGMSADFPIAIAFGATHVRVGTAIFGARASGQLGRESMIRVFRDRCGPSSSFSRSFAPSARRSRQSAPKPARATWMNTALPRPATRGRVLWSISMMRS